MLVCLVLLLAVPSATTDAPHERDGFVIGSNLGPGSARVHLDGGAEDDGGGVGGDFDFLDVTARLNWYL